MNSPAKLHRFVRCQHQVISHLPPVFPQELGMCSNPFGRTVAVVMGSP
jgi:hypothetical protein